MNKIRKQWWTRISASVVAAGALLGAAVIPALTAAADDTTPITLGFIYVGSKSDYGYNQAQAEGAAEVAKLPGVKILEEENVPETVAVQKTMESMIKLDGASVIFPTSYGYFDPHMLKMAAKYPDVTFLHCGGMYNPAKHPKNVGSYFGYIDECEYIAGILRRQNHQIRQARLHRRQADSAGPPQHQCL